MSEFNLKSGNATPFKLMGSSPAKQTGRKPVYPHGYKKKDSRTLKEFKVKVGEGQGSKRKGKYNSKKGMTKKFSDLTSAEIKQMKLDQPMGSPMKQGLKRAKRPKKKDEVKTIQIPEKHIVQGKKNAWGGPVLKSPGEGGPKHGTGAIWNEEQIKKAIKSKERQTNKYKKSPMKQTTDRETMRAAAREKKKNISRKESIKSRKKEETLRHFVTKGTQKKGSLPRVPTEGGLAHNIRKAATWIGVANVKAKEMSQKKSDRRSPSR